MTTIYADLLKNVIGDECDTKTRRAFAREYSLFPHHNWSGIDLVVQARKAARQNLRNDLVEQLDQGIASLWKYLAQELEFADLGARDMPESSELRMAGQHALDDARHFQRSKSAVDRPAVARHG